MVEGKIKISSDVVAAIAGITVSKIEGVHSLVGGINWAEILNKKGPKNGVNVRVEAQECYVSISLIVNYGVKIHELAEKIQEKVKENITKSTGLDVKEVDISIEDIVEINSTITKEEKTKK